MAWLKRHWQEGGTKLLGYLGIAFGALSILDTATVDVIATTFGPKWGPIFKSTCIIAGAVAVAMRGHRNTNDIAQAIVSKASTGEVVASAQTVTAVAQTAVAADDKVPTVDKPKEK
jgi:hypothetical protein